jgi:hypothetical protein
MADTKYSALTAAGSALLTDEFGVNESGTSKKITLQQVADLLFTRINAGSGAAGAYRTMQKLASDATTQTSTTPAAVMTTTGVGVGVWHFKYVMILQSAATTTGWKAAVDHSGTVTHFVSQQRYVDTSATASTGTAASSTASTAAGVTGGFAEHAKNTITAVPVGVVAANTDFMVTLEGIMTVSVSGDLKLMIGTEVAASGITLKADSILELTKVG